MKKNSTEIIRMCTQTPRRKSPNHDAKHAGGCRVEDSHQKLVSRRNVIFQVQNLVEKLPVFKIFVFFIFGNVEDSLEI